MNNKEKAKTRKITSDLYERKVAKCRVHWLFLISSCGLIPRKQFLLVL